MDRRVASLGLVVVLALSCMVVFVPPSARANVYSLVVNPGETKYLSFGTCAVNDLILRDYTVTTWSTVFHEALVDPGGGFSTVESRTWGHVIESAGEWSLEFDVDGGYWSATVTYSIYHVVPSITVVSPSMGDYVNTSSITVSGSVDGWADSVKVSTDGVHYDAADVYMGNWNKQVVLGSDGPYVVRAEETITWGSYWAKYYDTVSFILDRVPPFLSITSPSDGAFIAGTADVAWLCSDATTGVAKREVQVGAAAWVIVTEDSYSTQVADGWQPVRVRVTDMAGNMVIADVLVFSDSVSPQLTITAPIMNAKISKSDVVVSWFGSDDLSGIDHYEVQIIGGVWQDSGSWTNVSNATSYEFHGLEDVWYTVNVKAVDKSGNPVTSTVGFGIYTSIWSQNGPYHGFPLYIVIAAIVLVAILSILLHWRKKGAAEIRPTEEPPQQTH